MSLIASGGKRDSPETGTFGGTHIPWLGGTMTGARAEVMDRFGVGRSTQGDQQAERQGKRIPINVSNEPRSCAYERPRSQGVAASRPIKLAGSGRRRMREEMSLMDAVDFASGRYCCKRLLGRRSKFFRTTNAFRSRRYEGPHRFAPNDQGTSYRRYGVLQRPRRLKINFCEIFDVVRFSTFATI